VYYSVDIEHSSIHTINDKIGIEDVSYRKNILDLILMLKYNLAKHKAVEHYTKVENKHMKKEKKNNE